MRYLGFIVLMLLPLSTSAQSYLAVNRLTVVPLNPTDFEVIEARGEGARGLWCAAANFVQNRFGAPSHSRLYVKSARGPSRSGVGRIGVVFTTDPEGLTPVQSVSVSLRIVGQSLPLHHALQFCRDYQIEPGDI